MGANGNPSGFQNAPQSGPSSLLGGTSGSGGNPCDGAGTSTATEQALKHNPGLSTTWSAEEQAILDEGLRKYASESTLICYAKVALQLPDKTVRDVALRCRWIAKKESGKRRRDDHTLTKKSKDKKEKTADPSSKSSAQGGRIDPPYSLPMLPTDDDDITFKSIGGPMGQLLEHNAQALNQISANLTNMQIQDNISLFCRTRDNILTILNDKTDIPEIMKQMPPIPVKINEELANSILPSGGAAMQR